MKLYYKLLLLTLLAMLNGCMPYKPPSTAVEIDLPDSYKQVSDQASVELPDKWWHAFDSAELNSLVEEALSKNLTVEQAWHRLRQAEMTEIKARAVKHPTVNAVAGRDSTRTHRETPAGSVETTDESWSIGLSASYEIDFWGRIESQVKASQLQVVNSREAVNIAATSVAGEVVNTWLQILSLRQQKDLLEKQLKANEDILKLIKLRFNMSIVTALDVFQQQQAVESTRASIPLIESDEKVQMNKLAVLLGKMPGSYIEIKQTHLPGIPLLPKYGVPSALLTMRPDIQSAMQNVKIAQWNLATAEADKLPAFSITASARYADENLEDLFDNWVMNLAANITVPLIDGNRLQAEVDRNRAVIDENIAVYKATVLGAVSEVENALIQEKYMQDNINVSNQRLEYARKAFNQAKDQYINGISDYLNTLTALLSVQSLEIDLVSKETQLLAYRIALYRSIGGSWYDNLERPVLAENNK